MNFLKESRKNLAAQKHLKAEQPVKDEGEEFRDAVFYCVPALVFKL